MHNIIFLNNCLLVTLGEKSHAYSLVEIRQWQRGNQFYMMYMFWKTCNTIRNLFLVPIAYLGLGIIHLVVSSDITLVSQWYWLANMLFFVNWNPVKCMSEFALAVKCRGKYSHNTAELTIFFWQHKQCLEVASSFPLLNKLPWTSAWIERNLAFRNLLSQPECSVKSSRTKLTLLPLLTMCLQKLQSSCSMMFQH